MKHTINRVMKIFGYQINRVSMIQSLPDVEVYKTLYSKDTIKNKRFYNIGAGGFSHTYWTNVDFASEWYAKNRLNTLKGIQYDLISLGHLPINTDSAEVVYSSHTVEHITDKAAYNMIKEAHRILKPNGYLRLTTPNIDLHYRAYKENDRQYFYWIDTYSIDKNWKRVKYNKPLNKATTGEIFLAEFVTSVSTLHSDGAKERIGDTELDRIFKEMDYEEALNYCCSKCPLEIQRRYPGNHINWWNKSKMFSMLKKAVFTRIYLSGYGQSFCPILRDVRFFDNTHPKISLYVEAIK